MSGRAFFLHSPRLDEKGYPPQCPFNSSRAGRTRDLAKSMGLLGESDLGEPRPATREEIRQFHTAGYIDAIGEAGKTGQAGAGAGMGLGSVDTPVWRGMDEYLPLAAGASITGARMIIDGTARVAFNPSGGFHHAAPSTAAGFCYVNDIVLAAMALQQAGMRVAVLDIDVHHGDGTQDAFYGSAEVLTVSMHEDGATLFPGTGAVEETGRGNGRGCAVNLPLPVGTYNEAYYRAFSEAALPLIRAFKPDVIVLELGMDALAGDPLAHLHLSNDVYVDIVRDVMSCNVPVLATGGGGYNIDNTVRSWALLWSVLAGRYVEDSAVGMGGVMLENTDWVGGLRDRAYLSDAGQRGRVDEQVDRVIRKAREYLFGAYGLR